jgi:hypothetical protein
MPTTIPAALRVLLAGCGLVTGISLVVAVLGGFALLGVLAVMAPLAVAAAGISVARMPPLLRTAVLARVRAGLVAGVAATAAYDASRWLLAPILGVNPWAALPVFGVGLGAGQAEGWAAFALGMLFHAINGVAFATAYAVLIPRSGVVAGIAWGMGLELAMLAIYPGWLKIDAIAEFGVMSLTGHLCYGAVLGWAVGAALAGSRRRATSELRTP